MNITRSGGYLFDAIITLVEREIRLRYKGSVLGMLWAVLSPLGMVLILYVLFSLIVPLNIPHYAAFIYSGLLPWTWFQNTVQTGAATLIDNRDLVRTPFFPKPLLPGVVTTTNFILYLLALPVLLALLLVDGINLSPYLLLLPIVWLVEAVVALAFCVLVAALGVLVRDVQHLLGLGMVLWFYLTPVFYDLERVPPNLTAWFMLNPMAVLVEAHRAITFDGAAPNWLSLGIWLVVGGILLALSLVLFHILEDTFVEEV